MVVNHFVTGLSGGAAMAAQRLHVALRTQGVDSRYWCRHKGAPLPEDFNGRNVPWPARRASPFAQFLNLVLTGTRKLRLKALQQFYLFGRPPGREFYSSPRLPYATPYVSSISGDEIVHLHWIAKLIDYPSFFGSLPSAVPIVWTLHDMNPFTGGCHYADECVAFATACRNCPQLARPSLRDLSHRNAVVKEEAYRDHNLHVVTPSRWLEGLARKSRLLGGARSFRTIRYGLDLSRFFPRPKPAARQSLGLPAEGIVVAFGAAEVDNPRKGFREYLAALALLPPSPRIHGLVLGQGSIPAAINGIALQGLGFVTDATQAAMAYAAADLFVLPTHADNLPQTALEAMACGTPVVAFDVGGVPEIVRPHETGLLVREGDVADLSRQIQWLAERPEEQRRLGSQARQFVEREFADQRQAEEYLTLYRTLLAGREGNGRDG